MLWYEIVQQNDVEFGTADVAAVRKLYDTIVDEDEQLNPETNLQVGKHGRVKQSIPCNLLRRFRLHADAVLLFISNHAATFANNVAERAVHMPKVKQKVSDSFRPVAGARNFCIIRTCLNMFRKQGCGMLDVRQRTFAGDPIELTA
jgi:transposase